MPRFSANLGFLWPEMPLLARVDAAARAGFRGVELHWPYDVPASELRARLEKHGLALIGLNTPAGERAGDFGLAALPGREAEFQAGFEQALAYAIATRCGAIHIMAGVVPAEQAKVARATLIANLQSVLPAAANAGITLLLEPINRKDRPGYFYERIEDAAGIVAEIGHPALRIMFDCYHVGRIGADVLATLRAHWALIGHIQFAAVPSRAEPDEGEIDYPALFVTLDRMGYQGWLGAEYRPRGRTEDGLGYLRQAE
jgi:2-dehydrotetronate isomerase